LCGLDDMFLLFLDAPYTLFRGGGLMNNMCVCLRTCVFGHQIKRVGKFKGSGLGVRVGRSWAVVDAADFFSNMDSL
jgi:hypothetical protein